MIQQNVEALTAYKERKKKVTRIVEKMLKECDRIINNIQKQLKSFQLPLTVNNDKQLYEFLVSQLSKVYHFKNIISQENNFLMKYSSYDIAKDIINWDITKSYLEIIEDDPAAAVNKYIKAEEIVYPNYNAKNICSIMVSMMDIAIYKNKHPNKEFE